MGNDAILSRYRQGAEKKRLSKQEKEVLAKMPNLGNSNNDDSKKNLQDSWQRTNPKYRGIAGQM